MLEIMKISITWLSYLHDTVLSEADVIYIRLCQCNFKCNRPLRAVKIMPGYAIGSV